MQAAITIRPERPDHPQVVAMLSALDAYLATLYAPEANHILSVQELLDPSVRFVAAWEGDLAVGCGAVRLMPGEVDTAGLRYAEIKRMYVSPAHRGRRIAESLLQQLEAAASAEGVGLSLLETGEAQTQAVRLYERCGYRRRSAFGGYPDNGLSLFFGKALA